LFDTRQTFLGSWMLWLRTIFFFFEIIVTVIHKNIKIKINVKNNSDRDVHGQIHDVHKINKNKYTQIIKNKTVTINTKCHFKLNVTFMNKDIEIKINKNNNDRGECTQIRSAYKIKERKYTQKIKNEIVVNDIKCHFDTNDIYINKNKNIEKNK
jgi:hypothetical protein